MPDSRIIVGEPKRSFLLAEYCPGPFYMGWHLYLRDSKGRQQRNRDGSWGWMHGCEDVCQGVFDALHIDGPLESGSCDDGAIARFAFAHSIPRQRIGKKPRGCVEVAVGNYGKLLLKESTSDA